MANYELISLNEATPQLVAPTSSDTGTCAGNIVITLDVTGQTINATGDTSAGDAAAIGYTATEGLILTGQGSTNDVTIKNDADTTVLSVATGTGDVSIPAGDLTVKDLLATTEVSIADDSVGTVTPPRNGGFMFLTFGGDSTTPGNSQSGILFYDVGSSLTMTECQINIGTLLDTSTSDVTGTTGTDTYITVAARSGSIKIENRSGGTKNFQIIFL
jgi:hypothetical protein